MEGAKAYILPGVAALLLLGYWLLVPSADDVPDSAPAAPPVEAGAPPVASDEAARAAELREIEDALGETPTELPGEYLERQVAVIEGTLASCDLPSPIPYRLTLVGAPGRAARISKFEVTAEVSNEAANCAARELESMVLPAPPAAGRSIVELNR